MKIEDAIKKLRAIQESGFNTHIAMSIWTEADVQGIAEEYDTVLTTDKVSEVLNTVESSMDAEVGINWESIRFAVEEALNTREEK